MRIFVYEWACAGGLGAEISRSLLREGRAMLTAVSEDFHRLVDVEVVTLVADSRACARTGPEEESERFRALAARCDWTLVIAPEFDNLLRGYSQTVLDAGGRLLGSMPAAIELTSDKLATAEFWRERGVPQPRTEALDPERFASFPPPWVMKPRHGAGSQATFLIRNRDDGMGVWAPAYHECGDDDFIVQQYVRGQPASVALLIGQQQTIALLPARQHLSHDGRFRYQGGSMPLPPQLAERARRLALHAVQGIAGLQGYVGVDLVLGAAGDDYAIEINPRLTTSYIGLRQLCRGNLAEFMLKCALGEEIESPRWEPREVRFQAGG